MAISDFTGKNIKDTYPASHALFAIAASHEVTFELSSSHAQTASFVHGGTF